MTVGAIVVPLVALAVCTAGAWFAWRLVRAADEAGDEAPVPPNSAELGTTRREDASTDDEQAPDSVTDRSGVHLLGLVVASAAILFGLGGIGYVLASALGIGTIWLLLGYAVAIAIVAGAIFVAVRFRSRAQETKRGA